MPNHADVEIDPSVNGVGTYYIVISADYTAIDGASYSLTVTTTEAQTIETPESQLVFLDFDGGWAQHLADEFGPQWGTVDAFDAGNFDLETMQADLIAAIADQIEQIYRDAGLGANEIAFTTTQPAAGTTYTTLLFGDRVPDDGLGRDRRDGRSGQQCAAGCSCGVCR